MINFGFSRFDRSTIRSVSPSTLITAEGAPLVVDPTIDNGVKVTAGAAGEQFAGVSISQQLNILQFPQLDSVVVSSTGTFSTTFTPIAGTIRVVDLTQGADVALTAVGSAPTTAQYAPGTGANNYITNTGNAGHTLTIYYRFAPTVAQAQAIQGTILPGGDSGALLNTVGVVIAGDVYTSEYDTSADWLAAGPLVLYLGANGLFTTTSGGVAVPNARVIARPTANNPFLGVSILNG